MKAHAMKMALAIVEILIGLVFAGIGFYYLLDVSNCSPAATYCVLGLIPVILFLLPGCAAFAAGCYSFVSNGRKFRFVQTTLAIAVVVYYAALMVLWVLLAS